MGCGESKDLESSRFSSLILDPEEESLHLKSWQDARTRQRALGARESSLANENEEEAETIVLSRKALAFHSALMRDESSSTLCALPDPSGKSASRSEASHVSENLRAAVADSMSKDLCSSADTVDGSECDELRSRREQVEHDQEQDRLRALLKVDPACWQGLAEQGYFQKAEDTLLDSSAAELKLIGRTARYAQCMHALGALYDQRSNLDVTGQQQLLSLTSADYALRALDVWEDLVRADPADRALQEQQAASLLLRGRSLCNYAIDGDGCGGGGPTEDEAFAMAAADLGRALGIRERLGLEGLAEAVMAVGYLHYCRAGCLMRTGRHGPDGAELLPDYREALRHYTRSLNLYIDRDGQAHGDSIRMMCNIALVHNTMSRQGTAEARRESLGEAERWYTRALAFQERLFGRRHHRTQRIQADLKDVSDRRAALDGTPPAPPAPGGPPRRGGAEEEAARQRAASELMEEFLRARRAERSQEQAARTPPGAGASSSPRR